MPPNTPHILLVNPWIHDFAAYDVWASPLGLLTLAGMLRRAGYRISFTNCLDRFHPRAKPTGVNARNGRGPYLKTPIPKPAGMEDVQRRYCRYGIHPEWLLEDFSAMEPPEAVLVTSQMTYWWPGVAETISVIKSFWPETPVILGGIYATLCTGHAQAHTGADLVVAGPGEVRIFEILDEITQSGIGAPAGIDSDNLDTWPFPALDLQRKIPSAPLLASLGCPFACAYCASHILQPKRREKSPQRILEEIRFWHTDHGVEDFAFYDDALFIDAERRILPLLASLVENGPKVRFHTPNALHIRQITAKTADLMFKAGFKTLRLGLEVADTDNRKHLDSKVARGEFSRAVAHLHAAGFPPRDIGVYLLAGLPGQPDSRLKQAVQWVKQQGASPIVAHYTPIPQTALWEEAVSSSRYDLTADPVFTNNAILPCRKEPFSWKTVTEIKHLVSGTETGSPVPNRLKEAP